MWNDVLTTSTVFEMPRAPCVSEPLSPSFTSSMIYNSSLFLPIGAAGPETDTTWRLCPPPRHMPGCDACPDKLDRVKAPLPGVRSSEFLTVEPNNRGNKRAKGCLRAGRQAPMRPALASINVHIPRSMKFHVVSALLASEFFTDVALRIDVMVTLLAKM